MSDEQTKTPAATPSKNEVIQQIGKTLQERRGARSLTLEKVSQILKIRLPYLQAIERGAWDELPGEVYVRGFVRRYAQYLGLDGEKLLAPYLGVAPAPVEHRPAPTRERPSDFGRTQIIWGVLGLLFIAGFLKVIRQEHARSPIKPQPTPIPSVSPAVTAPAASTTTKAEPAVEAEKHVLSVVSPYPLWLRVSATDKNFEGFIPQSATWTWKGEGKFTVRLGHTKQVKILFDGRSVPLQEDQKSVTLPAE